MLHFEYHDGHETFRSSTLLLPLYYYQLCGYSDPARYYYHSTITNFVDIPIRHATITTLLLPTLWIFRSGTLLLPLYYYQLCGYSDPARYYYHSTITNFVDIPIRHATITTLLLPTLWIFRSSTLLLPLYYYQLCGYSDPARYYYHSTITNFVDIPIRHATITTLLLPTLWWIFQIHTWA